MESRNLKELTDFPSITVSNHVSAQQLVIFSITRVVHVYKLVILSRAPTHS